MEYTDPLGLGIVVATLVIGLVIGYLTRWLQSDWRELHHRMTHTRIKRPCPTCAPWGSKGWIQPTNRVLLAATGGDESQLPKFDCSACQGAGYIVEEYKKGEVPEISEDGKTISTIPQKGRERTRED